MTFAAPSKYVFDEFYSAPVVRLDFENAVRFEELEIDG